MSKTFPQLVADIMKLEDTNSGNFDKGMNFTDTSDYDKKRKKKDQEECSSKEKDK